MYYMRVAERLFNQPLLITPDKADIIANALKPRFLGQPVSMEAAFGDDPKDKDKGYDITPEGIAILPIEGTLVKKGRWLGAASGIRAYEQIEEIVLDAATDPQVKALLLDLDSPGGEVNGLFELMDTLFEMRDIKPLWAVANDTAMSAAYGIASAAQRVYVTLTGGVGSVGAVAVHLDMTAAHEERGWKYEIFRSRKYKAEINQYEPLSSHGADRIQGEVDRVDGLFVERVARNRGMTVDAVGATEADIYFAQHGVAVGFADQVGTLDDAHRDLVARLEQPSPFATLRGTAAHQPDTQEVSTMSETTEEQVQGSAAGNQPAATVPEGETNVIDLDEVRRKANQEGQAQVLARVQGIHETCTLAGCPERASQFIQEDTPVDKVRSILLGALADQDQDVDNRVETAPDARAAQPAEIDIDDIYARANAKVARV